MIIAHSDDSIVNLMYEVDIARSDYCLRELFSRGASQIGRFSSHVFLEIDGFYGMYLYMGHLCDTLDIGHCQSPGTSLVRIRTPML